MKISCVSVDVLNGERTTSKEVIDNLDDFIKLRAAVVHTSKAWFNDVQIVKNGYITSEAYNYETDIVAFLLGNITREDLDGIINKA